VPAHGRRLAPAGNDKGRHMRIAHIGSKGLPSRGATERVVEAIATRQALDHDVTVYGSRRVCASARYAGIRVVALPVPAWKHLGPVVLDVLSAACALVRGYDVVHVHGSENAFVVPLLRLRSRVVTTNHGSPYEQRKWSRAARAIMRSVEGVSVRWASEATCVSRPRAERLQARYGVPVRFIPNGVDRHVSPEVGPATRLLASLDLEPGAYVMFSAARVDATKGCLTLIRAWREAGTGLPLLVVGDLWHTPGHEEELREAAQGSHVVFLPRLDDVGVLLGLIARSALFVFPSTVEAMSIMLLEAISTGARVVASDIAENMAVLPAGFPVFRAGDERDLTRAIAEALAEAERDAAPRYACWAREMADAYDWDRIAEQYMQAYRGTGP
jgi:glycosyltransferase involved in cell wall biosynthesis